MTVKKGDFIRIDYNESVDGKIVATTDKDVADAQDIFDEEIKYGPRLIIVGSGQLVAGLEEDLIGKEIGYFGRIEVAPEKAFGTRDPGLVEIIPLNKFKDEKPVVGMRVGTEKGIGIVSRIIGRKVSVDFNHPLADKMVVYDYKIFQGVEDREEKLRGLITTFAKFDLEFKIDDEVASIYVPWELSYYKEWLMIRRGLADMILMHLGLKEVDFIEKHTGAELKAELISPPSKEGAEEKECEAASKQESSSVVEQGSEEAPSS